MAGIGKTRVIIYSGTSGTECQLCGAGIKFYELCEQTLLDGEESYCCRKCTEAEAPEEYARLDYSTKL